MTCMLQAASLSSPLRKRHFLVPALLALSLGYLGFRSCVGRPEDLQGHLDLLYMSLQLFVFESGMDCGPGAPWTLQVARLLAPLVPVSAAIYALCLAFRDQIRTGRLLTVRNHAVVCGLGRKGSQLVRDLREQGISVVAIELDGNNDHMAYCLNLGALVLVGSAGDRAALQRAAVQRARVIVAISGDDGINMDSMLKIHDIIKHARGRRSPRITGYVHVVDFHLCELFKTQRIIADRTDRFEVKVFNVHEATVRRLFAERPLDHRRIRADDPRTPHLICVGLGKTGEALVVQAARTGHFANGRKLRVTVVDLDATAKSTVFDGRPGWIREVCDLRFIQGDIADEVVLLELLTYLDDPNTLASIMICMNDDSLNLRIALHLHAFFGRRDVPICVRMMEIDGLTTMLAHAEAQTDLPIYPFGMGRLVCTTQMLDDPHRARLAQSFHAAARSGLTPLREPGDDEPWHELAGYRRDAFCLQADHLPVMLRGIGCELVDAADQTVDAESAGSGFSFAAQDIETLASMEHRRRMTDGLIAGQYGIKKDSPAHLNVCGRVWEQLNTESRRPYREHIAALPRILGDAGWGIRRTS